MNIMMVRWVGLTQGCLPVKHCRTVSCLYYTGQGLSHIQQPRGPEPDVPDNAPTTPRQRPDNAPTTPDVRARVATPDSPDNTRQHPTTPTTILTTDRPDNAPTTPDNPTTSPTYPDNPTARAQRSPSDSTLHACAAPFLPNLPIRTLCLPARRRLSRCDPRGLAGARGTCWQMPTLPAASSATVHVDEAGLRPST